jgi:PleD family two-component response regulator
MSPLPLLTLLPDSAPFFLKSKQNAADYTIWTAPSCVRLGISQPRLTRSIRAHVHAGTQCRRNRLSTLMNLTNPPSALSVENAEAAESCKRVLIAEDDVMFRKILQSWLQAWGYKVALAEDGTKAWAILQEENPPELLILDWMMPGIDGTELCRRIRDRQRGAYQYILLVTAKDDKQDLVRGLDAGADDYLTKPFDRSELRARLRVGRRILTLQDDLIRAREELRFQATHDVLTTLWNRGALLELLQRELQRATRCGHTTGS